MNHKLNARVAREVMRWVIHFYEAVPSYMRDGWVVPVPDYSGSLDAAFEMEEEIEQRGVRNIYIAWLLRLMPHTPVNNYTSAYWGIIHASPEQRCKAALEAVREEKKDTPKAISKLPDEDGALDWSEK